MSTRHSIQVLIFCSLYDQRRLFADRTQLNLQDGLALLQTFHPTIFFAMTARTFPMATLPADKSSRPRKQSFPRQWQPTPHRDDRNIKTHDFAYATGLPDPSFASQVMASLRSMTASLTQPLLLRTLVLIFGGCCSNVYTLEAILTLSSATGTLITCLQFAFITIYTLPSQLTWVIPSTEPEPLQPTQRVWIPRLKRRTVPLEKWAMFAAQFVLINVLNNAAFGYKISLPLHIILRSAGPVASMAVGYLWTGKTYSSRKVFSVLLLFFGVVVAAWSDASSKPTGSEEKPIPGSDTNGAFLDQAPGFALLTTALLLSAVMGIWSDTLYSQYGRNSKIAEEQLFYGHLLSLPFFLAQYQTLHTQIDTLLSAQARSSVHSSSSTVSSLKHLIHKLPQSLQSTILQITKLENLSPVLVYLMLNGITQIVCISGVHHLSTQTSALTVSIVLNVRKVVSLLLSIYLFGNNLPVGVLLGAAVVFVGGGLYGLPESKTKTKNK